MVQPPEKPKAQTEAERRQSIRLAHLTEGWLYDEVPGPASRGRAIHVFDMSTTGVGFKSTSVRLEVGQVYRAKIGPGPLHVGGMVRIVHRREETDGIWSYGAEFVREPQDGPAA